MKIKEVRRGGSCGVLQERTLGVVFFFFFWSEMESHQGVLSREGRGFDLC